MSIIIAMNSGDVTILSLPWQPLVLLLL